MSYSYLCFQLNNMWLRRKLPVVVGGTNYYIESLLWDFLLQSLQASTDYISILFYCITLFYGFLFPSYPEILSVL